MQVVHSDSVGRLAVKCHDICKGGGGQGGEECMASALSRGLDNNGHIWRSASPPSACPTRPGAQGTGITEGERTSV